MKFLPHKFSDRFPPVECSIFVVHETNPKLTYFCAGKVCEITPSDFEHLHWKAGIYRGTAAAIVLPDGKFWIGVTLCATMDQFIKSVGRAKALGRAYQIMRTFSTPHGTVDPESTLVSALLKDACMAKIAEAKKRLVQRG